MAKIVSSLVACAVAWLIVFAIGQTGWIQGRAAMLLALLAVLPPIFVVISVAQVIRDADAQTVLSGAKVGAPNGKHALYLRAFHYDGPARQPSDEIGRITHALDNLWRADRSLSAMIETIIKRESGITKIVSVLPPGGSVDPSFAIGGVRPTEGDWKHSVSQLAETADIIIIAVGLSEGVQWEFELLKRLKHLGRTVVVIPPLTDSERSSALHRELLRRWVEGTIGGRMPEESSAGCVITFSDDGSFHHLWPFELSSDAERVGRSKLGLALRHAAKVIPPWGDGENPIALAGLLDIALAEKDNGHVEEARLLEERLLQAQRNAFGDEYADTLRTMNNLALTLRLQGDLRRATALQQRVITGMERVFGRDHLLTLQAVQNLGQTLSETGAFDHALTLHDRAIEGLSKTYGGTARETLTALENKGCTLIQAGRVDKAIALLSAVKAMRASALGPADPDTLRGLRHLVVAYVVRGDFTKAIDHAERLLDMATAQYGADDPLTVEATAMRRDIAELADARKK
jgi:tetratricopeptide (TPR) repeat protein